VFDGLIYGLRIRFHRRSHENDNRPLEMVSNSGAKFEWMQTAYLHGAQPSLRESSMSTTGIQFPPKSSPTGGCMSATKCIA
jgi:hypothetical protein